LHFSPARAIFRAAAQEPQQATDGRKRNVPNSAKKFLLSALAIAAFALLCRSAFAEP